MTVGNNGVAFTLRAIADLKGINDTAKALNDLTSKGNQAGQGLAAGLGSAEKGFVGLQQGAENTANALATLSTEGAQAGSGIASGMEAAGAGLATAATKAETLEATLGRVSKIGLLVGAGIFAGLGVAVKGASDLNESLDKASRTFGANFAEVDKFAQNAAESMGLSRREALDSVSSFGLLFNSIGAGSSDVLKMSEGVTQLAADLGSLFNVGSEEAQNAILSGLVGESKPLRQFNILLSETAVAQELAAEGAKKVNGEYTEAQKVLARYNLIMQQGGPAAGNFVATQSGVANSAKTASAELHNASDALGTAFLPVVAHAAQGVAGLAGSFSHLPASAQEVTSWALAGAGGLALLTGAAAKSVSIAKSTADAWKSTASALQGVGGSAASVAAGLGLAAGVAAVTVGLVEMQREAAATQKGIDDLRTALQGIRTLGQDFTLQGLDANAADAQNVAASFAVVAQVIQDARNQTMQDQTAFDIFGHAIPNLNIVKDALPFVTGDLEELGKQSEAVGKALAAAIAVLSDPNVDTTKFAAAIRTAESAFLADPKHDVGAFVDSINAIIATKGDYKRVTDEATASDKASREEQAKTAIQAKDDQDLLNKTIQETLNQRFLVSGAFQDWMLPFIRGADDAEKAAGNLAKGLDSGNQSTLDFIKGIKDIAPELDGMQAGFGRTGDSIVDIFRKMDDLGAIDLSPSTRAALDAASTLEKVQAQIDGVDKAIQQNQGDMSMWQGRIGLVTDAFGANSQQLSEWEQELQNGQITQEQFNAAVATLAGSGGFPKLDALFQQGKISQEQYNQAKEAGTFLLQRSAGGIQDENAELVDNIINLAAYVRAHDDADGAVKKLTESQRGFLAALDDDKVGAFLQRLQLLVSLGVPKDVVMNFIADASQADPVIAGVVRDLGLIPPDKTTKVNADATGYHDTVTGINGEKIPDKVVTITTVQQSQVSTGFGGVAFPNATPSANPAPVVLTADDQATPVITALAKTLNDFATNAGAAGAAAGVNFSDSFAGGLNGGVNAAIVAAGAVVAALDIGGSLASMGDADGSNYGIGIANGIAATWNAVFNAAYYVAGAAHAGTQAGMDAHSPSKLALAAGINWGGSVAAGIRSTAADVHAAGRAIAALLPTAFANPDTSVAMRAALGGDSSQTRAILAAAGRGGTTIHHHQNITVQQTNQFHGITDVKEIVSEVHTQTYRAFDRGQAAGIFGS